MSDRLAVEKRHREFTQATYGADKSLYAAAANVLRTSGWKFVGDSKKAFYGWWVRPGTEFDHPMGDSKEFHDGAFKTVQLYTTVEINKVQEIANEFRMDERKRIYNL